MRAGRFAVFVFLVALFFLLAASVRVRIRGGRDWALIVPVCGDASSEIKP